MFRRERLHFSGFKHACVPDTEAVQLGNCDIDEGRHSVYSTVMQSARPSSCGFAIVINFTFRLNGKMADITDTVRTDSAGLLRRRFSKLRQQFPSGAGYR